MIAVCLHQNRHLGAVCLEPDGSINQAESGWVPAVGRPLTGVEPVSAETVAKHQM